MKAVRLIPLWVRLVMVIGLALFVIGGGLGFYRYMTRAVTLSVAVGSLDGETARLASAIAAQLAAKKSPIRLTVINSGSVLDAEKLFASGKADLAIVRSDVGDLSQARSIARIGQATVMLLARAGAGISDINDLKGHTVGVVGGDINGRVVAALTKQYDLGRAHVKFINLAPEDARRAIADRQVSALLTVMPLTAKYIALLKSTFRPNGKSSFVMVPIDDADAIAEADRAYESFDIPRGMIQGSPPIPSDDLTTMRVSLYLVANKALSSNAMTTLTQELLGARDDLIGKDPALASIAAADTDPDAYITVHPGAAAYYNGTQQSFMDKYGDDIYLTPMILGALASMVAAVWRFLGVREPAPADVLVKLYSLRARIRDAANETDLDDIEAEIDRILDEHLQSSSLDDRDTNPATLNTIAQRLEGLIHHRRMNLRQPAQSAALPSGL